MAFGADEQSRTAGTRRLRASKKVSPALFPHRFLAFGLWRAKGGRFHSF